MPWALGGRGSRLAAFVAGHQLVPISRPSRPAGEGVGFQEQRAGAAGLVRRRPPQHPIPQRGDDEAARGAGQHRRHGAGQRPGGRHRFLAGSWTAAARPRAGWKPAAAPAVGAPMPGALRIGRGAGMHRPEPGQPLLEEVDRVGVERFDAGIRQRRQAQVDADQARLLQRGARHRLADRERKAAADAIDRRQQHADPVGVAEQAGRYDEAPDREGEVEIEPAVAGASRAAARPGCSHSSQGLMNDSGSRRDAKSPRNGSLPNQQAMAGPRRGGLPGSATPAGSPSAPNAVVRRGGMPVPARGDVGIDCRAGLRRSVRCPIG